MSWDAFFSLQGAGPYLWGSFGMWVLLMGLELLSLRRRDPELPDAAPEGEPA